METSGPGEAQARAEQLLRDAHIQRMRRQWAAAETLCRQALELAPDDGMGLEMLGDLLADKGSLDEALEVYRRAFAQQPTKAVLEEKIARVVLQKGEEERERLAAQLALSTLPSKRERRRNAILAVLLSLLCPGAGQIFVGHYKKGAILAAAGLLSLFFGVPELFKMMLGFAGALPRHETVNELLAAVGLVGVLVYLYSLLDASAQAGKPLAAGD